MFKLMGKKMLTFFISKVVFILANSYEENTHPGNNPGQYL